MELKEFVSKINLLKNDELKINMIQKHIKRSYCPVQEKLDILYKALAASTTEQNYVNIVINKILVTIGIVFLYTDINISIDFTDSKQIFEDYDLLKSSYMYYMIEKLIEDDICELLSLNDLLLVE